MRFSLLHFSLLRSSLFIMSAIILTCSSVAQAKMYKWIDEEGQMHFGDKIPPKYLVKEHDEINEQGLVVEHKKAAKTAEEKAVERQLAKEQKKQDAITKKKKQRDRVLLDTYTTERDLFVARDSRLDAVGSQIQLATSIIEDSKKKVATMDKQVSSIQGRNKKVPEDLYHRIKNQKQQITVQTKVMQNHKIRRDKISVQFNEYIERFRVLKAEQKAKRDRIKAERGL